MSFNTDPPKYIGWLTIRGERCRMKVYFDEQPDVSTPNLVPELWLDEKRHKSVMVNTDHLLLFEYNLNFVKM